VEWNNTQEMYRRELLRKHGSNEAWG
jgi:hypothetical protein